MTRIGIAADHGGFELKVQLIVSLKAAGYEVTDFVLIGGNNYQYFRDSVRASARDYR